MSKTQTTFSLTRQVGAIAQDRRTGRFVIQTRLGVMDDLLARKMGEEDTLDSCLYSKQVSTPIGRHPSGFSKTYWEMVEDKSFDLIRGGTLRVSTLGALDLFPSSQFARPRYQKNPYCFEFTYSFLDEALQATGQEERNFKGQSGRVCVVLGANGHYVVPSLDNDGVPCAPIAVRDLGDGMFEATFRDLGRSDDRIFEKTLFHQGGATAPNRLLLAA